MLSLTVSTFPNAKALPLWAALEQGIFARYGLAVRLHETGSSAEQRQALADGELHIVQAALDNALELVRTGEDVIILMGGEAGMNDFIVRPGIGSFAELAGQVLAVDSPHTAYALLARKLLATHGLLLDRDYAFRAVGNGSARLRALKHDESLAGAILNPPFSAEAQLFGLRSLGRLDELVAPYQAGGAFALRRWVAAHEEAAIGYMAAYIEALGWLTDAANRADAVGLLCRRLKISQPVASATHDQICDPVAGFTPRAKLSRAGFDNMLEIRRQAMGGNDREALMRRAIDESLYELALARCVAADARGRSDGEE
jgi:ABC-type nitrate/sulfonate/bicarbonate transport system substrate-binding protein